MIGHKLLNNIRGQKEARCTFKILLIEEKRGTNNEEAGSYDIFQVIIINLFF